MNEKIKAIKAKIAKYKKKDSTIIVFMDEYMADVETLLSYISTLEKENKSLWVRLRFSTRGAWKKDKGGSK